MSNVAHENLAALRQNPYPGRGIVVGLDETGEYLIQVYWIMGRSENSQNRVFSSDEATGRLFTEAADPARVSDPSLIIYDAMLQRNGKFTVSNGKQTGAIQQERVIANTMNRFLYEPDKPNFTPRISAVSFTYEGRHVTEMAILRKSEWSDACDRQFYYFGAFGEGIGHCITTYTGDGNPLPAFHGEPYLLPLEGKPKISLKFSGIP